MSDGVCEASRGSCEVCQQVSERRCSACKLVFYCSAEHQREHWIEHKDACRPYEVGSSDHLGKYLKARRDLNPSDVIFTDSPIVFGPKPHRIEEGSFPCVGCCRLLDDQTCERCPECFWPVCKTDCPGLKVAQVHGFECKVLKLRPPSEPKSFFDYYRFDVLIILRALYLQKVNGKKWETMLSLQDHLKDRGPNTKVFKSVQEKCNLLQENYLQPLRKYEEETGQSILPVPSHELIHKIYGILDVNATELSEEFEAYILYPTASLLEHDCTPNTIQTIDEKDNFKITFRAALPIKKDEHITSIYTHILWGTTARRHHLKKTKYFVCTCKRCQDPTEMGTYINALKCLGVEREPCGGVQLPLNPIEGNCQWTCNKCDIKLPNKDIMKFVHHLSHEVDKLMARHPKIAELEDMLGKLLNFLHPNHYLVYSLKHTLVQLYGSEGGIEISDTLLNEKLKMCEELIDVTTRIDPGNARLCLYLGVLLNEQFIVKFKLLLRNFNADCKDKFEGTIKEIRDIIERNKVVLSYEKQSTAGSKLFEVILGNERKFTKWKEEHSL
ncbi:protein msta-like [Anoplophora glabripennis]|uniref:protein msta-like n=1 Tax=Anoplophora glabripennis TaxID=217634 RepID=UPI000874EC6C|nr:protein msta-like [Anoplophora glabripennis]